MMPDDNLILSALAGEVRNRTRRTRETAAMRRMVRETRLSVDNLIYPMFVVEGENVKREISSMPGQYQLSVDRLVADCAEIAALDIPGVILFGIPDHKDDLASQAYAEDGVVQNAVRALKEAYPELCVITDVCLCEYMDHGHCGIIEGEKILNDPTLELIDQTAVSHAEAGADIIAPSDMMDGRVGSIRTALDAAGFTQTPIMAYSAKVLERLLRTFPRGGGERARLRRQEFLPDGPGQRARGHARDSLRYRGGGGHHHGEARTRLSRRYRPGARDDGPARRRL